MYGSGNGCLHAGARPSQKASDIQRTVILIKADISHVDKFFLRGGIDHRVRSGKTYLSTE